jgi:outer membrane protein insertion porin family
MPFGGPVNAGVRWLRLYKLAPMKSTLLAISIVIALFGAADSQTRRQQQDHFRIARIHVEGTGQFTTSEVIAISGLNPESIASPEVLDIVLKRLLRAYHNRGRLQAQVAVTTNYEAPVLGEMRKAEVEIEIQEGPVFVIHRLEFMGNKTTRDRIIRRRVLLNEGEPYSEDLLEASLERLNELGLFTRITLRDVTRALVERGRFVDLLIRLREKGKR